MTKRLLFTVLFFIICKVSAQKSYNFDFVAEYKIYNNELGSARDNTYYKRYDFINSKDNSYLLLVHVVNKNIHMQLVLDDGRSYHNEIPYDDFFVTTIGLKCPKIAQKGNSSYENLKEYEFDIQQDTAINTIQYKQFSVRRAAARKKGNITTAFKDNYIIDNTLDFKMPIFYPTGILYRKWKKGFDFPKGIIKEIYGVNEKNNKITTYVELLQCTGVEKHISVDYSNCND